MKEAAGGAVQQGARLAVVDGLRALAAVWVVLFHVRAFSHVIFPIPLIDLLVRSGSTGVSLFLVLSGFCLYIPYAAGRQDRFRVRQFFIRRWWRLMPAYYASLGLVLLATILGGSRIGLSDLDPRGFLWQLVSHLLMIHTLFPSTFYALNGAYWSLGLEWQLYLTLPILVWIAARRGILSAVAVAIGFNFAYRLGLWLATGHGLLHSGGILATAVLPNLLLGRWAEFGYGMLAAELYAGGLLARIPRAAALVLIPLILAGFRFIQSPFSHLIFGAVFFVFLMLVLSRSNLLTRALSVRPVVAVGVRSYSLYLIHAPILWILAYLLGVEFHLGSAAVATGLLAGLPIVALATALLFQVVERRSLAPDPARSQSVRRTPAALAAPVAPAESRAD